MMSRSTGGVTPFGTWNEHSCTQTITLAGSFRAMIQMQAGSLSVHTSGGRAVQHHGHTILPAKGDPTSQSSAGCSNEFDLRYGSGYCTSRKAYCTSAGFRQECRAMCGACIPGNPAISLTNPPNGDTHPKSYPPSHATRVRRREVQLSRALAAGVLWLGIPATGIRSGTSATSHGRDAKHSTRPNPGN